MQLTNQVAVITGAASGMGAETARYLAGLGVKVALLDRQLAPAQALAAELQGMAIECDVTSANSVEQAVAEVVARLGSIRIGINCAGVAPAKRIVGREGAMPLEDFERVIQINLVGSFNVMRVLSQQMSQLEPLADNERGVIISTASVAAYEGQVGQAAYSASKGGIVAMTLPAARELARFGIRVMTIAPGIIATPLLLNMPQEVQTSLASQVPFPARLGQTQEYAALVAHIIENNYLNGTVIRLDGALRMT